MTCTKEFEVVVFGECIGLSTEAVWVYNPNMNPGQPPAAVTLTYDFEGYHGSWQASRAGGAAGATVIEWRTDWTSSAGKTLRVRATLVGSVTRGGTGATVICRSNANGNQLTQSQVCPPNVTTNVNLDVTATDATLGGPAFIDINHQVPSDGVYDLSGEVFVDCF